MKEVCLRIRTQLYNPPNMNDDRLLRINLISVALKGRVALQMGSNELLITELILKNVLTVLQPAEIVALLSALIFQQRTDVSPQLTPSLANVHVTMFYFYHSSIGYVEKLKRYFLFFFIGL